MSQEMTVDLLRAGYPSLIEDIEKRVVEKATAPLTEERDQLKKRLEEVEPKLQEYQAKEASSQVEVSIRSLIEERAKAKEIDLGKVSEVTIKRVIPYLVSLDESKRAEEVDTLIEDWKPSVSAPKKHLGERPNESDKGDDLSSDDDGDDLTPKMEGYISDKVEEAAKALTNG